MTALNLADLRTLAPLAYSEGISAGPDGSLWTADARGDHYRIDPSDGSSVHVASVDGIPLGLCLDSDGYLYTCLFDRGEVIRVDPESGRSEVYCTSASGTRLIAPNWPVFAPDGTMFVSDSGTFDLEACDGRLIRVPPGGGEGTVIETPALHFANGLALRGDGVLFVIESFTPRVLALVGADLSTYVDLPRTVPDGLALDEDGGLLASCFQPNRIVRVPPGGGEPTVVLDDWTGTRLFMPTNIAFFGRERRSLAIASARGWRLAAIETPWRGQALSYPRIT